jgi:hypothetical protein
MRSRPEWLAPAIVATLAVATSMLFSPVAGPRVGYDSLGYLKFADTLQAFGVVPPDRPDRLPGYPLLILVARALAAPVHANSLAVLATLQVVLLAGLAPLLAYGIGRRATGRRSVGLLAAVLVATDLDLQHYARAVMTEAPATTLVLLALWLRLRDDSWRRSAWALAAAVMMKPYLASAVLVMGALDALRLRRPFVLVASVGPTALLVGGWLALFTIAGGRPIETARRIRAFTDFITIYQAGLFTGTVQPAYALYFADAARRKVNAYEAAKWLTGSEHPANQGSSWQVLRSLADTAIRKRRSEYVAVRLAVVPYAWSGWQQFRPRAPEPVDTWRRAYGALFVGSLWVLGVLSLLAVWNGLGWPRALPTMRVLVVPTIVVVLVTVASMSAGTYEVGREVILVRPLGTLLWACVLGHVAEVIALLRSNAGSRPAPRPDPDVADRR